MNNTVSLCAVLMCSVAWSSDILLDTEQFESRCDAIFFTQDLKFTPPNTLSTMKAWRGALQGVPSTPEDVGSYDLVVTGGVAGADYDITMDGQMGPSNIWAHTDTDAPTTFQEKQWAMNVHNCDFPEPPGAVAKIPD